MRIHRVTRRLALVFGLVLLASRANAQSIDVHGFFDLGATRFTAANSFDAVLGSPVGIVFGGGAGVTLSRNIFVDVRASRFTKDGQRVAVNNGDVFALGISNTVTITPLEITGGYRFGQDRDTIRPYAGGGISWYRYQETDQFASEGEAVDERFTGFNLLGGAEFRLNTWLGLAGELAWASVPDALGQQPSSVGTAFGETNLGGTTVRARIVIGR